MYLKNIKELKLTNNKIANLSNNIAYINKRKFILSKNLIKILSYNFIKLLIKSLSLNNNNLKIII